MFVAADSGADNPDLVEDVSLPPDLPLEMIAEEVKNSWRLKVSALAILRCSIPGKEHIFDGNAVLPSFLLRAFRKQF